MTADGWGIPGHQLEGLLGGGSSGVVHRARRVPDRGAEAAPTQTRRARRAATRKGSTWRRSAGSAARNAADPVEPTTVEPVGVGELLAVRVLSTADEQPLAEGNVVAALRTLQRVSSHQYLVDIVDAGVHQGRAFLVMPYLDGGTLADRVAASGPLSLPDVVAVVADVAAALDHAHEHGVLHLNVHPGNVFRLADGRSVLADAGIATLTGSALRAGDSAGGGAGQASAAETSDPAAEGHPRWAPELLSGKGFSAASDVYGLAWTAHRLLGLDGPEGRAPRLVQDTIRRGMGPTPLERQHSAGSFAAELARAAGSASPVSLLHAAPTQAFSVVAAGSPVASGAVAGAVADQVDGSVKGVVEAATDGAAEGVVDDAAGGNGARGEGAGSSTGEPGTRKRRRTGRRLVVGFILGALLVAGASGITWYGGGGPGLLRPVSTLAAEPGLVVSRLGPVPVSTSAGTTPVPEASGGLGAAAAGTPTPGSSPTGSASVGGPSALATVDSAAEGATTAPSGPAAARLDPMPGIGYPACTSTTFTVSFDLTRSTTMVQRTCVERVGANAYRASLALSESLLSDDDQVSARYTVQLRVCGSGDVVQESVGDSGGSAQLVAGTATVTGTRVYAVGMVGATILTVRGLNGRPAYKGLGTTVTADQTC